MSAQTLEHLDGYISEALTAEDQVWLINRITSRLIQHAKNAEPLYSVEELIARSMESVREFEAGEFVSAEESNRMMDEHIAQVYAPAV